MAEIEILSAKLRSSEEEKHKLGLRVIQVRETCKIKVTEVFADN